MQIDCALPIDFCCMNKKCFNKGFEHYLIEYAAGWFFFECKKNSAYIVCLIVPKTLAK